MFLQENWPLMGFALVGGLVLGMGNLLTQYAWPFVVLSIVDVISSNITMVVGWYSYNLQDFLDKPVWDQLAWHKTYNRSNVFVKLNF